MTEYPKLKILVVDDTVVYRKIVGDILSEMPGVASVETANNGKIAVARMGRSMPDLLILDVEMPEMNGLQVLAHIQKNAWPVGAIMLSSFTQKGSQQTIEALELGAFDFIPKPETSSIEQSKQAVRHALCRVVEAFSRRHSLKNMLKSGSKVQDASLEAVVESARPAPRMPRTKSKIVVVGISTGGPNALKEMLPQLPADLGVPVLIVQHMPPIFTKSLADSLNRKCQLEVLEASDGDAIEANKVYIAPGGKHMKVSKASKGMGMRVIIKTTDDPLENGCRPAVDYLFRSVSQLYGAEATAVVMTGMGCDGKLGMKLMKRNGCATIAQDKSSCVVYGMPKEVIEAGVVDVVAPLHQIAHEICRTVKTNKAALV